MLFGKRKQIVKRILIVEDEPLTAFDNENMLGDAGYHIVATVDDSRSARNSRTREVDLILSDIRLRRQQTGIDLAQSGEGAGNSDLIRHRHHTDAASVAVGCLIKPYSNDSSKAIESVDRHLQGETVKGPEGAPAVRQIERS